MNSIWLDSESTIKDFQKLNNNLESDVCIIGAGIFGITCAYYLCKLGFKVTVLEKYKIANKTTGHTTAKITSQHGLIYNYLINSYGRAYAKDYLLANENAIQNIKNIISEENINCDFEDEKNYIYTTDKLQLNFIKKEVDALNSLGLNAKLVTTSPLPFDICGAVQTNNQAQFHPLKYINGLLNVITKNNGDIYIDTEVTDVKKHEDKYITYTNNNNIKSKYVIIATHYPFLKFPGIYFAKMYQSTSYAIGLSTNKKLFDGMYINTKSPIYSFRTAKIDKKRILILGGAEHKTGQYIDYENSYGSLEKQAKKLYPDCEIIYKWNTRDCITLDKIPYIGKYSNIMDNMYIGTGFNKWGMTSSNVAANIIKDMICNKQNPYQYVFDSTRVRPIKNRDEIKNIVSQSINSLLIDKIKSSHMTFDDISNDSGGIVEINNNKIGIYKNVTGKVFAINPICTHLGCLLSWNDADKTWDCPCHGSRFDYMGKNLYDPAIKDLDFYNLD